MDIQIMAATVTGPWLLVGRTLDGQRDIHRYPRETLAIRAAEYDLDPADPFVLDMVLLERFIDGNDEIHPLFSAATISSATDTMRSQIAEVQDRHGAPKGKLRPMAAAIKAGVATKGLVRTEGFLVKHADRGVDELVRKLRDRERERLATKIKPVGMVELLRRELAEQVIPLPQPPSVDAGTNDPESNEHLLGKDDG